MATAPAHIPEASGILGLSLRERIQELRHSVGVRDRAGSRDGAVGGRGRDLTSDTRM